MRLRKATFEDWELLLNWRNDAKTRNNFHNTFLVEENNHKKWLRSVLMDKDRHLFIGMQNDSPIGMVRADLDHITLAYELSWTISPSARGKGFGTKMVKLLIKQLNGCKRAEIKRSNISSIKIAELVGMKLSKEIGEILHYSTCS